MQAHHAWSAHTTEYWAPTGERLADKCDSARAPSTIRDTVPRILCKSESPVKKLNASLGPTQLLVSCLGNSLDI